MFKKLLGLKKEEGNVTILISIAMVVLLGMTGLVIDGGTMYMSKAELQKTANAAALSGVHEILNGKTAVDQVVEEVLDFHGEKESLASTEIENGNTVRVLLDKEVPLAFSRLFGRDAVMVQVGAAAEYGQTGSATGAVPLGIDERFELEYYRDYELKTDTEGVDTGWFGILALDGPGAATYYQNFRYGYQEELKVGDIIDTETGNVAGKTRSAVNERISNCSETFEEAIKHMCSRVILVPTYLPIGEYEEGQQIKQVEITGFAYFYLSEPVRNNDTSVHGMFIKKTGPGFIDETATSRGAYSIRLTE